jgi:hypothetical protein
MVCGKESECAERYLDLRMCPHCQSDLGFPNVRQARKSREALQTRYDDAKNRNDANVAEINEF